MIRCFICGGKLLTSDEAIRELCKECDKVTKKPKFLSPKIVKKPPA